MSSSNGSAALQQENVTETSVDKGKGKAAEAQDVSMDEGDDSSSDEEVNEVSRARTYLQVLDHSVMRLKLNNFRRMSRQVRVFLIALRNESALTISDSR